jgi:hypothetical protein
MTKLPDATSIGRVAAPSNTPGVSVQKIDFGPMESGAKAINAGVQEVSAMARRYGQKLNDQDDFRTQEAFINFKMDREQEFQDFQKSMPAGGEGFQDGWRKHYDGKARDFFKGVPDHLKDRYDLALVDFNARLSNAAKTAQDRAQDSYERDRLENTLGRIVGGAQADADRGQEFADEGLRLIESSRMSPAAKLAARNAFEDRIVNARMETLWKSGREDEARALAKQHDQRRFMPDLGPVASTVDKSQQAKAAYSYFVSQGWTPQQAAGIVGGLMHESSFKTTAFNGGDGADGSDSIGMGQWNSDRAAALRKFAAAKGKPVSDFQTQLEFVQHELSGSEKSAGDELRNAKDVRQAAEAFLKYERPQGFQNGLAGAHGGRYRLGHAEAAFKTFGGGTSSADAPAQSPGVGPTEMALTEFGKKYQRQKEAENRQAMVALDTTIKDDLASIERTGQGVAPDALSRDKVAKLAGEEAARDWEMERARAFRVHEALDGIEQLPEGEVLSRLQAMEPKPGTEGYADDIRTVDRARAKADKFLEARRSDPALAAEAFETVRQAKASIQYVDNNGVQTIAPESAQKVIQARLSAQAKLGIDHPMAVTRSEAALIARQLRAIGEENPSGLQKFMESLNRTYGPFSEQVLASTIEHQRVNRDLSVMASQILSKVAAGVMPRPDEARRTDQLIDTQVMQQIMPPPPLPRELRPTPDDRINAARRRGVETMRDRPEDPPQAQDAALATPQGVADVKRLIQDPSLATEFDMKYNRGGPGLAEKILKDYARRAGAKPNG